MLRRDFLSTPAVFGLFGIMSPTLSTHPVSADTLQPFYLPPVEPLQPGPMGLTTRTRVRQTQTNGQFSCVEFAIAPKKMGPAPHLHQELDELMYVVEGTISVMVGEEVYEVKAGGWHLRPRGIVHTFWNATSKPAVGIDCYFQQPFEEYLEASIHTIPETAKARGLAMNSPEVQVMYKDLRQKFGMISFPDKRQPLIDKYNLNA